MYIQEDPKRMIHVLSGPYGTLCGQSFRKRPGRLVDALTDKLMGNVCPKCKAKVRIKAEIRRLHFTYEAPNDMA